MSTATPTRKPLPGYYQFGAGAFAGVTEICIFYPLAQSSWGKDVVKTRMQLDTGKSPSMLTSFKNIIRQEGAGRLYRGLVPPLLLEAPKRAVKFAANDFWGKAFIKNSPDGKMTQGLSILTGAAAGATESFVVVPFELVKIRLQDKTSKYAGPMDVVRSILRQHGPLGLYAGMESTFWRRRLFWHWIVSETTDRILTEYGIGDPNELNRTIHTLRSRLPKAETPQAALLNNFVSGAAGGFVGTALNTPFDVVKSRIQGAHPVPGVVPKYNWTYPSLALILREEGAAALYKGFVPKVLRLAPGGGVLLLVVEAVLGVVRKMVGPPTELAAMLAVSRRTNSALKVEQNPGLHARIFDVKFDSRAPTRRFQEAGQPLTALSFAHELRRRWIGLKRIRGVSGAGKLSVCSEEHEREDQWMIYLMFLESDGRNYQQLHWARVTGYVRTLIRDKLMPSPRPGYMHESTSRAIGLWLMWFLTEVYTVVAETQPETAQMHTILRPWALASHKYDTLCAPYTHWNLPSPDEPDLGEDPVLGTHHHFLADLDLRNRTEIVMHMGRRIYLAPPRASVAAIMAFMVRLERNGPIPARDHPSPPIPPPPPGRFPSTIRPDHAGLTIYPRTRYPAFYGPGSPEFDGRVNRKGSAAYDSEWRRIVQCGNPFASPAFRSLPTFRPGDLAGHWEGRFVVSSMVGITVARFTHSPHGLRTPVNQFLTFDAFRDMLAGVLGAVTNGPIAQQPHVWRIHEHHLVQKRRRIPLGRDSDLITGEPLPVGAALDAYIPRDAEFVHHGEPSEFETRRLEVQIPDETLPSGFKSYYYTTLDGPTDLPPTHIPTAEVLSPTPPLIDMDLSSDWGQPAPPTLGDGDDEFEEQILDTLITGEGHSSWGSFKLRGRIRAWDGMIILVKDYDGPNTQGRGRWLYKGYVVSGGNWVGRWRDTFTSELLSGYEGVFSVTRRY
ncbi:mitochondrial carrier family [Rhizoctonia solani]|uniref:Mitochondrial carrier family n=1 Tax=Rhizoctonia solani TaxID=456999 RepID=A0A8H7ILI8_9AGAM|nr:mitochondrial carrier family [Rhizoctonia solani]